MARSSATCGGVSRPVGVPSVAGMRNGSRSSTRMRSEPAVTGRSSRQPGAPGRTSTRRPPDRTSAALVVTTAVLPVASAAPRDGSRTAPLTTGTSISASSPALIAAAPRRPRARLAWRREWPGHRGWCAAPMPPRTGSQLPRRRRPCPPAAPGQAVPARSRRARHPGDRAARPGPPPWPAGSGACSAGRPPAARPRQRRRRRGQAPRTAPRSARGAEGVVPSLIQAILLLRRRVARSARSRSLM